MSDYDKFKKFFDEMGIEYEEKEYHSEKSLLMDENSVIMFDINMTDKQMFEKLLNKLKIEYKEYHGMYSGYGSNESYANFLLIENIHYFKGTKKLYILFDENNKFEYFEVKYNE